MSSGVDAVAMLVRWTMGEPGADERREDVVALLNEVVHLQAGRDEDTERLAELEAANRQLRGQLAAQVAMHDLLAQELNAMHRKLAQARAERDAACEELVRERGDAVAALRRFTPGPAGLCLLNMASVADAIEQGEHRQQVRP